ncbi:MAG: hypothetical protein FWG18_00275 [Alphaproteobacteria bacterium]|nr:hypothetical protein [Alphaproteobacteria bacterium]
MSYKSILKTLGFAGVAAIIGAGAAHAASAGGDPCVLIASLGDVFKTLRTLAFVGAIFCMAGWAWGYISAGKVDKWGDEAKTKGVALLVGFFLLFSVGIILQFLPGISGCRAEIEAAFR